MTEMTNKPVYFYGCLKGIDENHTEAGHYWRQPDLTQPDNLPTMFGRYPDGTLCPAGPQYQGKALLTHKDGWTAIGFWDRTGDSRGNSNSNFFVQGTYTFDEMVKLATAAYPLLWRRFGRVEELKDGKPNLQD